MGMIKKLDIPMACLVTVLATMETMSRWQRQLLANREMRTMGRWRKRNFLVRTMLPIVCVLSCCLYSLAVMATTMGVVVVLLVCMAAMRAPAV